VTKTKEPQTRYHAAFELDPSGQWLVELDEIPQVHSFGRTLGKAREHLLDALALWLGEPAAAIGGRVDFRPPDLPAPAREAVHMAMAGRAAADAAARVAAALTAEASLELVNGARLSMRDAADVLGLSHQRIQQLVTAGPPDIPRRVAPPRSATRELEESLRALLPGGSTEDVGGLAAVLSLALGVLRTESQSAAAASPDGTRAPSLQFGDTSDERGGGR
jgi:predicted RNase H-like HicB family nuclease